MQSVKIKGKIIGTGGDYTKHIADIPAAQKLMIRINTNPERFFYLKGKKNHYTQTGYKICVFNPDRYEYYHREPSIQQLTAILRKEKKIK